MCEGECDHQTAKGAKSTKGETAAADEKKRREEEKRKRREGKQRTDDSSQKRGRNERMCRRRRRSRQKGRVGERAVRRWLVIRSIPPSFPSAVPTARAGWRARQLQSRASTVYKQQSTAVSMAGPSSHRRRRALTLTAHGSVAQSTPALPSTCSAADLLRRASSSPSDCCGESW